jgi:NitT/TauT family transport system substrate-binding protein
MQWTQSRRRFLGTLSSFGAAGLMGAGTSLAQEGPPETATVRLAKIAGICIAPQYVADELLRAEGFTDIRFVATDAGLAAAMSLARGEVDFTANFAPAFLIPIDAGEPITILGSEHIGCFEVFARDGIRSFPDLKGKNVGVPSLGSSPYLFLSTMAAHVGLDRGKTSTGSPAPRPSLWSCSLREKSMRSSAFRPSPKTCAPAGLAASSSTAF